MANSATPAPSQTVKGIDQNSQRQTVSVYTDNPNNPGDDSFRVEAGLKIDNLEFQETFKFMLKELSLIRRHLEILTGETLYDTENITDRR